MDIHRKLSIILYWFLEYHILNKHLINRLEQVAYERHIESLEESLKSNPKEFWKFFDRRDSQRVAEMTLNGQALNSEIPLADHFAEFFGGIYKVDPNRASFVMQDPLSEWAGRNLDFHDITKSEVRAAIEKLKANKS